MHFRLKPIATYINMGGEGMHSLFVESNNTYVRRRCQSHISWRVSDAGINEMTAETWDLATYLREGVTWGRLSAIATQSRDIGGLQLFPAFSAAHRRFKEPSPPSVLDARPETNWLFLQWLIPRQALLSQLIPLDVQQRGLRNQSATSAAATIQNRTHCLLRRLDLVLLHKGLFLFHYNQVKKCVVADTTYDELVERASTIITSLDTTDITLKSLELKREDFGEDELNGGWVKLALRQHPGFGVDECEDFMPEAMAYHLRVSMRMSGHLRLTWENVNSSEWLAGGILSKDPNTARACARLLHDHLKRKSPSEMRPFEAAVTQDEGLMLQIDDFASQDPPCLVWRRQGRWAYLFKFLAGRFTGNGDTVLDCESMHARWKWISEHRRSIRFRLLNSVLKLALYLERHGDFPVAELYAFSQEVDAAEAAQYAEVRANPTIDARMRAAYMWQAPRIQS